jgi:acyl dehydratase
VTVTAADVHVGLRLPDLVVDDVRPEDIKLVALILRDPNPIHFDTDAVARAGLGEVPINQGGSTMAYVMNLLVGWTGTRASIRSVNCRFRGNVAAGDDVVVGGVVTTVEARPAGVLVGCDVWADVVDGLRAIEGSAHVLVTQAGS